MRAGGRGVVSVNASTQVCACVRMCARVMSVSPQMGIRCFGVCEHEQSHLVLSLSLSLALFGVCTQLGSLSDGFCCDSMRVYAMTVSQPRRDVGVMSTRFKCW